MMGIILFRMSQQALAAIAVDNWADFLEMNVIKGFNIIDLKASEYCSLPFLKALIYSCLLNILA